MIGKGLKFGIVLLGAIMCCMGRGVLINLNMMKCMMVLMVLLYSSRV